MTAPPKDTDRDGRTAVVVPGQRALRCGAGETIRRRLLNVVPNDGAQEAVDRGYRMAKLAVAYGQAGQVQTAATVGLRALVLARQTCSARTEKELGSLGTDLAAWSEQSDVATFLDALRTHPQPA